MTTMNKDNEITITSNDVKSTTVYTVDYNKLNGANDIGAYIWQNTGSAQSSIDITGENADITLNGKSMRNWMEKVEERLAILEPNTKLEQEWDELKQLGDQYRTLEKQLLEKTKAWNILKGKKK